MKVANETKIGALTLVALTLLVLGFNFLKGKSVFKHGNFIYAKFQNAKGILPSHPVLVNGFQVGSVFEIEAANISIDSVVVAIKLNEAYRIPVNSVASITDNPLGTPSISIEKGDTSVYLSSGDNIKTADNPGLLASLSNKSRPIADQLQSTLTSLNTVLKNVNSILDPNTKGNLQEVILNLNKVAGSLLVSSASIEQMLNAQTGSLALSMNNLNKITQNFAENNGKITGTLDNLEKATAKLSKADIDGMAKKLNHSAELLNVTLSKVNSTDGSIGAMLNDKRLYNNLNSTVRSLNTLMDDLRVNPKRYMHFSVFGKKATASPLTAPIIDSTGKN